MLAVGNQPATPEDKVVHDAINWRTTEKRAIKATASEQQDADRAHHRAKMMMRESIDLLLRRQS